MQNDFKKCPEILKEWVFDEFEVLILKIHGKRKSGDIIAQKSNMVIFYKRLSSEGYMRISQVLSGMKDNLHLSVLTEHLYLSYFQSPPL